MTKNILIVTYQLDWDQCLGCLLPSINKFLPDACVRIVDNTIPAPMPAPVIKDISDRFDISCQIVSADWLLDGYDFYRIKRSRQTHSDGWFRQQLCKLSGWKLFDSSFIVLDSELEIIRPITAWPERIREHRRQFVEFSDSCRRRFQIAESGHIIALTQVPWQFEPEILLDLVREFKTQFDFYDWFIAHDYPSEFVLYDIYQYRYNPQSCATIRPFESNMVQYIYDIDTKKNSQKYDFAILDRSIWRHQ
jgi:hypothetical protein